MNDRKEAPPVGHNEDVRNPLEAGSTPVTRNLLGNEAIGTNEQTEGRPIMECANWAAWQFGCRVWLFNPVAGQLAVMEGQ